MADNQFNPVDTAAKSTPTLPKKKPEVKTDMLAAIPDLIKNNPVILPPKKSMPVNDGGDGDKPKSKSINPTPPSTINHPNILPRQALTPEQISDTPNKPVLAPVSVPEKQNWNKFIDFVDQQGFKGNAALDKRDTSLGMALIQKFNKLNPDNALPNDIVSRVQQEIQNYRNNIVNQWKSGKAIIDNVKSEDEIMPNISPVDGWPGSKTLSHYFPTATLTTDNNGVITKKNFGVNFDPNKDLTKQ